MASLPYTLTATVTAQGGAEVLSDMPIQLWPSGGHNETTGRYYDHSGECPYEYAEALSDPNLSAEVAGVDYKIVSAIPHAFFPHVALFLRRSNPGGGA